MKKYPYPKKEYPSVSSLPEPVQAALKAAFYEARCMDLYEDSAVHYLQVIRQRLQYLNRLVDNLETVKKEIHKSLESISKR
jgi:hypothetical protein